MPRPDPYGIYARRNSDDDLLICADRERANNWRHREKRFDEIVRRIQIGDWICWWCKRALPLTKRADARYCSEVCRKRMARKWREHARRLKSGGTEA